VLKNLKIGIRLGLGFGLVLLLLLAISMLGVSRMESMNKATQDITDDAYPKVVMAKDLIRDAVDIPRQMRGMLLTADAAEHQRYRKQIEQLRADSVTRIDELTKLVASEGGKKLLKQIVDKHAALEPSYAQFYSLVDSDRQRAAEFVSKDVMPANREFTEAVYELA
jgi:methyl-accepting chemotaxis protein